VLHAYKSKDYEYNREKTCTGITYLSYKKEGWIDQMQTMCQWQSTMSMDGLRASFKSNSYDRINITSIIEAKENIDVAKCDIPNTFIQTEVEK